MCVCVCILWLLQIELRAVTPSLIWKQLSPGFLKVVAQGLIFSFTYPLDMSQFCLFLCRTFFPSDTQVNPSYVLVPSHHTKHSFVSGWTPRGFSVFSNIKALPLRSSLYSHCITASLCSSFTTFIYFIRDYRLLSISSHSLIPIF